MANGTGLESAGRTRWLVPRVFHDIIARLIPGAVIIASVHLATVAPDQGWNSLAEYLNRSTASFSAVVVYVGVGALISYSVAILLSGLWFLLAGALGERKVGRIFTPTELPGFHEKFDFIMVVAPRVGNRISKLGSEMSGARLLAIGFAVAFAVLFVNTFRTSFDKSRIVFGGLLLAGMFGAVGASRHFDGLMKMVVKNNAALLGYEEDKSL